MADSTVTSSASVVPKETQSSQEQKPQESSPSTGANSNEAPVTWLPRTWPGTMFMRCPGTSVPTNRPTEFTVDPEWASEHRRQDVVRNESKLWHHLQPAGKDAREIILLPATPSSARSCGIIRRASTASCSSRQSFSKGTSRLGKK